MQMLSGRPAIAEDVVKIIEVAQPERMLDAKTKTAMMTVATWADYYRLEEGWYNLQHWRQWEHGKQVNEVSHFGEYTTMQGDVLAVCPLESEDVLCQVQVVEIRMVDCQALTDSEVHAGCPTRLVHARDADAGREWPDPLRPPSGLSTRRSASAPPGAWD
jgi:hypothetical protein